MDVISVYNDVKDNINTEENGDFSYALFNRLSKRAELRLLDYLTGDVEGLKPPEPYLTQKNKDWVSKFITKKNLEIVRGLAPKPDDYYAYENMYLLAGDEANCEEKEGEPTDEEEVNASNKKVTLLDGAQFNDRCDTYIESLKPTPAKPIIKIVGNNFEFSPRNIYGMTLEYIRYPKFAKIRTVFDDVYHEDLPNSETSDHYEWDEYARELLIWFITDTYSIHNREQALKKSNQETKKSERG